MVSVSERYITQMKLRELRLQREKTLAAYAALAAEAREVAATQGDTAALRLLYERLREMKFANQPLHPEVANLELLLRESDLQPTGSETVSFWRERLERELGRGELRAEIVYIFGRLLEEQVQSHPTERPVDPEQAAAEQAIVNRITAPNAPRSGATADLSPLDAVYTAIGLDTDRLSERIRYATDEAVYQSIEAEELRPALEQIATDGYRSPAIRREARRVAANETLIRELADALTIALNHLDEWDWPASGVRTRTHWANTKWRLFLDEDLPDACLLALLGLRWRRILQAVLGREMYSELTTPGQHLPDLSSPQVYGRDGRRDMRNFAGLSLTLDVDACATDELASVRACAIVQVAQSG